MLASSAIVLVSEIVAARVIAPYVGITLETLSAVIGCVLAGISLGSWMGGWLADRVPIRRLLTGALALGGLALVASPYVVRVIGPRVSQSDPSGALLLAAGAFLLPSIALSAVTPTVLKAVGQDSSRLGSVAGAVSAIGTAGALIGNFGAGFVLVGTLRSGTILVLCGAACLLLAAATAFVFAPSDRGAPNRVGGAAALVVAALVASQLGRQLPCDTETKYVCLNIDQTAPGVFLVRSNIYSSSSTNVSDPSDLEFSYVRDVVTVTEASLGADRAGLRFGYVGGGGYTLPLYFEGAFADASHVVYEIDEEMVERVTTALGIENRAARFTTRIGDARTEVAASARRSMDVVVGDAFSGITVPWHLTTKEFLEDVSERLTPTGLYVMNLIDYDHYELARAEATTFRSVFNEVVVVAPQYVVMDANPGGANILLVGAADLPDTAALNAALRRDASSSVAISGAELDAFIGDADALTDDFAPVDQLLGRP